MSLDLAHSSLRLPLVGGTANLRQTGAPSRLETLKGLPAGRAGIATSPENFR